MEFKVQITSIEYFLSGIKVINDRDYKKLCKLNENEFLDIKTWKERNILFHKKYFALMNASIYHLPEYIDQEFHNIDNFRKYVTILTGRFNLIPSLKGESIPEAHSIKFDKIDDEEFKSLYSDSINVILKYFLKDISKEDFENDILNFI